ncbi:LPS export ABC transporter periplasmic protein LptC [Dysgonomonas sp. 511]|uniref:LPS export ABC transporter periplasmic protein LptC n=1 Tax=Dysgonomonas sp. 511 TaxID=2302930 RepID=UPI0013D52C6B|nr:LPS export ABC transporter periplasmic protein LptC [Dysgonomonas sp. 511]NDV79041.1 LPS export ABC transporter periplasmic protein LptC [Dysgonomonas sp. 511]
MKLGSRQTCLLGVAIAIFAIPFLFASCKKEVKNAVDFHYDSEQTPTVNTDSVTMLISDSGIIRYKVITQTWEMFNEAKDPHSYFPDKVYLEQYDTLFNIVVVVKADTAWNYSRRKLWRLKGNVFIRNVVGETFTTEELFWDQQKAKIYSDKPVEVNSPNKGILRGKNGFESNQNMTDYEFKGVGNSPVYVREQQEGGNSDTVKAEEKTDKATEEKMQ